MEENEWQLLGIKLIRDWHKKKHLDKMYGVSLEGNCDSRYFPIDYFDDNYCWDDMDCGYKPMYINNLRFAIFCLHFFYQCHCRLGLFVDKLKGLVYYGKELLDYLDDDYIARSKKLQKLHNKLKYLIKVLERELGSCYD